MRNPESDIQVQGYINNVAYTLSGPTELVEATIRFIRNLINMHRGIHIQSEEMRITIKQQS